MGTVPRGVDYVIDCAAYGNRYDQTDLWETLEANVHRVKDLLAESWLRQVKKVILISSSSVKLPEQTVYSATKTLMEAIGKEASEHFPVVVMRPFTLYGIGDHSDHFIPKLFEAAETGKRMRISLLPVHDYVYIEDFIDTIILALENQQITKGILEVGTGKPTTNKNVIDYVEEITGKTIRYIGDENLRPYDWHDWFYKGEALHLKTNLKQGLKQIYDYQQRLKKTYS